MDRGVWRAAVHGVAKSRTLLSDFTFSFTFHVIGNIYILHYLLGGSDGKESACIVTDPGSIPGSRRSCGEGNGSPLQYSCLGNPVDRGSW